MGKPLFFALVLSLTLPASGIARQDIGSGPCFIGPVLLAVEASGNIVLIDNDLVAVVRVDPVAGDRTIVSDAGTGTGPNFNHPVGIAVEASGDLVVTDNGLDAVLRVDPVTGDRTIVSAVGTGLGPSFNSPYGIAVEASGDLVVTDSSIFVNEKDVVVRVDPVTGDRTIVSDAETNIGTGPAFELLFGVTVEASGDLVVVDSQGGLGAVVRVDPVTGDRTIVSKGLTGGGPILGVPVGIAVEASGDLVVIDASNDAVVRVDPVTGDRTIVSNNNAGTGTGPNFNVPAGVAVEASGDLVVTDSQWDAVVRVDAVTGDRTFASGCELVFNSPTYVRVHHNETDLKCVGGAPADTFHLARWDFGGVATPGDPQGWTSVDYSGFGDYAGLYYGPFVLQEDRCLSDFSWLWGFFDDPATTNYACATPVPQPAQGAIAYGGPVYLDNEIWSPSIECIGTGSKFLLEFDVYRDLDLDALVFYTWKVRSMVGGQWGEWRSKDWYYYGCGRSKDWIHHSQEIGDLLETGASHIQVALGVRDNCDLWCGSWGTGACHSQGPLFDAVRVVRVGQEGPAWDVRQINLFQDNFAEDGTLTGRVRADAALDIAPMMSPTILPGDSVTVCVGDKEFGLLTDPYTLAGAAVYCYVSVWPQLQEGKAGIEVQAREERDPIGYRYPLVNTIVHDGATWWCFRMDTVFCDLEHSLPVPNEYCIDLNDYVFTPGDTVCFVFSATNTAGDVSYWTEFTGVTNDLSEALSCPMEFTCLPAGGWQRGGDILYVDAFDGRGAQPLFDHAFLKLGILDKVDRYDQRGPSSLVNNGLASRVKNVLQLQDCYTRILWNSGDLPNGTVGDGSMHPVKSDDYQLLFDFVDTHPSYLLEAGGVWFSGDNIGQEWAGLTGPGAVAFRSKYMNFNLYDGDHVNAGSGISPCLVGVGEPFNIDNDPDTLVAYGGCPKINNFDVFEPYGPLAVAALVDQAGFNHAVSQITQNTLGGKVTTLLEGFSYHYIRSKDVGFPDARTEHLKHVLEFVGDLVPDPTVVPDRNQHFVYFLDDAYPNPFNPVTTIKYGLKEPTHVSLKIYNVAGQLVKTLVDRQQTPQLGGYSESWDGTSNHGTTVASGVYFYRLKTEEFTKTKKMVLLK